MPERESASPQHDPDARLGDLFENLPDPTPQIPTVDNTPPPPGSRRAAREAATNGATLPADDSTRESESVPSGEDTATRAFPVSGGSVATEDTSAGAPAARDSVRDTSADAVLADGEGAPSSGPSRSEGTPGATAAAVPGARLEDLFHAPPEDEGGSRPPKKKRRKGCLVALIIVLAVLGGIVGGGVWAMNTFGDKISDALGWGEPADWEAGQATGEVLVTIKEGDTGAPVSTALYEAGVTRTDEVFYDYLVTENVAVTFYPGIYRLQEKMTAAAALEAIQNPDNKLEHSASIGEGATIESSLPGMAESLGMPIEELQAAVDADPATYGVNAPSLEGWLFPAVYTFDPDATATQVIQRMVDRTNESLNAAGVPAEDAERILTIASIIQREGRTADFAKVSRVIQNRLDIDMKLQMDSTAQYGYGSLHEGVVSSSAEALEDPNDWNTYVHTGLPVTPIASPSDAAIKAAMNPEDGPWLYFVTINLATGETQFSETYEEHLQGVAKWEQWCQENPDGGCSAG